MILADLLAVLSFIRDSFTTHLAHLVIGSLCNVDVVATVWLSTLRALSWFVDFSFTKDYGFLPVDQGKDGSVFVKEQYTFNLSLLCSLSLLRGKHEEASVNLDCGSYNPHISDCAVVCTPSYQQHYKIEAALWCARNNNNISITFNLSE